MEKYGVLKELECSCGCRVIADNKNNIIETVKAASVGLFGIEHLHEWKEVTNGGKESSDVRSEQYTGEDGVRTDS